MCLYMCVQEKDLETASVSQIVTFRWALDVQDL